MIGKRPLGFVTHRPRRMQALVLAVLLVPLALYPLYFGLSALNDSLAGDMLIRYQLQFESRRRLLMLFLSDWRQALPMSYVLVIATLVPLFLLCSRLPRWRHTGFVIAGALVAVIPATYLQGGLPAPLTATGFALGGAVLAAVFALIAARPRHP